MRPPSPGTGTITAITAALNGLDYTPVLDFTGGDVLLVTTNDNGNNGTGGPETDIDNINITVDPLNDPPVNTVPGDQLEPQIDLAVLATGMQPEMADGGAPSGVTLDSTGFVISDLEKGLIGAGCAKKAADVATTTQSSTAAALKAIQVSRR